MAEDKSAFRLLASLGNPGKEYHGTRHNAGFTVAESLAENFDGISSEFKIPGGTARKFVFNNTEVHIVKPLRFMNLSGETVASFIAKKNLKPENLLVIHDDMDIPVGRIRIAMGGGAAGHKGIQSIIDCLGSANFARLRFGIGRGQSNDARDYVLSVFDGKEKEILEKAVELSVSAVKFLLENGVFAAMNEFNGRNLAPAENRPAAQKEEN
jgi:PTH1 family peptidyl-tRNA hydrolase